MEFIEINDSIDYENVGHVNKDGVFENASTATNIVVNNPSPNIVDNQNFYRDFSRKNPQQQRQPKPILKQNTGSQQPQKKVTYDDILSSLNMKVVNGKLQIIRGDDVPPQVQRGKQVPPSKPQQAYPSQQAYQSQQAYPSQQGYPSQQAYTKQNEFYNKFLQAQQQQQMVEEEVELTPEQIAAQKQYQKRLIMIQYIKNQQQRMRVGQIKSKKMKFV